ncbi:uncharacterized protein LOC126778924 [Nymphalis io]|uniref:uncharacterized protein LOC126778924 n=1 Tax=Inachis io TaxID=171585 RepID=UPI002168E75B|nr:uncharacterized protein LOC126778924 [Nymphalis io]
MVPVTIAEPAVQSYILYSSILALKVLGMAVLTARERYRKKVFANEEDAKKTKGIVKFDDPDVERVRRAHLNDLENIPVFWVLGALYLTTGPSSALATLLFRVYTAGRVLHTIVYAVKPLPQPARGIAYGIPYLIKWYMGVKIVSHYLTALSYILYSSILAVKLLSVGMLTGLFRLTRGIFINPEDVQILGGKIKFDDPVVERSRRAHRNDIENIPAFWILGALYVTTGPAAAWAKFLFRVYTVSRIIHTVVYTVVPLPQPTRVIVFKIGYLITWYMGIQVVFHYITAV